MGRWRSKERGIGFRVMRLPNRYFSGLVWSKVGRWWVGMGALTSLPYAFVSRPWELKSIESIDIFDSLGSDIRVDIHNDKVVRILPSIDEEKNEEWISNRTRFSCDGLTVQRIGFPLLRVRLEFGVCKRPIQWLDETFLRWGRIPCVEDMLWWIGIKIWLWPKAFVGELLEYLPDIAWEEGFRLSELGISSILPSINRSPCVWTFPYHDEEFVYAHMDTVQSGYYSLFGQSHVGCFGKFYERHASMDFGSVYLWVGWEFAFFYLLAILRCAYLRFCEGVCGFLLEGESIAAFKYFMVGLGSANMMCGVASYFEIDLKSGYLFNQEVGLVDFTQTIVLVGLNPRLEFPLLNVRLRRGFLRRNRDRGAVNIYSLGLSLNYMTYKVENLGNSVRTLLGVLEGKSFFCQKLERSVREVGALILLGMGSLLRSDGSSLVRVLSMFCLKELMGFSIVHETSGRIAAMDLGFIPGIHSSFISSFGGVPFDLPYESYKLDLIDCSGFDVLFSQESVACTLCTRDLGGCFLEKLPVPVLRCGFRSGSFGSFIYMLVADDVLDLEYSRLREKVNLCLSRWNHVRFDRSYKVYQGHHWEIGAVCSDLVLPSLLFVESEGLYLSYAGESRCSSVVVSSYREAESDWDIIRALESSVHWSMGLRIYWENFFDERGDMRDDVIAAIIYQSEMWYGYCEVWDMIWLNLWRWEPGRYRKDPRDLWDFCMGFASRKYQEGYRSLPLHFLGREKQCFYPDYLGQESLLDHIRKGPIARGKWFDFGLVENEVVLGLMRYKFWCMYFYVILLNMSGYFTEVYPNYICVDRKYGFSWGPELERPWKLGGEFIYNEYGFDAWGDPVGRVDVAPPIRDYPLLRVTYGLEEGISEVWFRCMVQGLVEKDYLGEYGLEEYGQVVSLQRHVYLWRLAPYFRKDEVDEVLCYEGDEFFVGWKKAYLPCFLLNTLFGILVDDYSTIDSIGRFSKALSWQSAALWHADVSFASKGHYRGAIRWS